MELAASIVAMVYKSLEGVKKGRNILKTGWLLNLLFDYFKRCISATKRYG
jgi:hypothetical protein